MIVTDGLREYKRVLEAWVQGESERITTEILQRMPPVVGQTMTTLEAPYSIDTPIYCGVTVGHGNIWTGCPGRGSVDEWLAPQAARTSRDAFVDRHDLVPRISELLKISFPSSQELS